MSYSFWMFTARFLSGALILLGMGAGLAPPSLAQTVKPNIVYIFSDDLGYGEVGYTGQNDRAALGLPHLDTPTIDALAAGGMVMERFYATPVCASSRSALMTGLHMGHASIDRNGGNNGGNASRPEDYTFGEMLQSAGYTTGMYGKWGLGGYDHVAAGVSIDNPATAVINNPNAIPTQQGFDEFYGYLNQVHAHDYYVNFLWEQDGAGGVQVHNTSTSDYTADLIAARSLDFITNHASDDQPFMLYAPTTLPHGNFDPPQDTIWQAYKDAGYTDRQADYAAMVKRLDNHVADIVDRLQDPNGDGDTADSVYDNTLILFSSDNGISGSSASDFGGTFGLDGTKNSVGEGGIASPFFAHWNGTIAPGQVNATSVGSIVDLFATFGDLAGQSALVGIDSQSLLPVLLGQSTAPQRPFHVFEDNNGNGWAIIAGDYKLLKNGGLQLYDVVADKGETSDLLSDGVTAQEAAIRDLLNQIALDEGVESDAGNGATTTTYIVQYKDWAPAGGSTVWNDSGNWAGGTQLNTRGTATENFNTPPAGNWHARLFNDVGGDQVAEISGNSRVLGVEIGASAGTMTLRVNPDAALTVSNGLRVHAGGRLEIDGGAVQTLRTVFIDAGGELTGSGEIRPQYDTAGTPFEFKSTVVNLGRIEIAPATQTATNTVGTELLVNGGFEDGTGNAYSAVTAWFNADGDDTLNARNGSSPHEGAFRAIVGANGSGTNRPSPAQETGHVIQLGDRFALSLAHAGASNWAEGADQIQATLFFMDGATPTTLDTVLIEPSQDFGSGYDTLTQAFAPITQAAAAGNPLFVRFESLAANGRFAALDAVSLELLTDGEPAAPPAMTVLAIEGDFAQGAGGTLAVDLTAGSIALEPMHDQLAVTGLAALAGALEVGLGEGFVANLGERFAIITAGQREGGFDALTGVVISDVLQLVPVYEHDGVVLEVRRRGDLDGDQDVDQDDLNALLSRWGQGVAYGDGGQSDWDVDGLINAGDLAVLLRGWTSSVDPVFEVPEPSAGLMLGACGLLMVPRRPRD